MSWRSFVSYNNFSLGEEVWVGLRAKIIRSVFFKTEKEKQRQAGL
jgi:hypothetical protein